MKLSKPIYPDSFKTTTAKRIDAKGVNELIASVWKLLKAAGEFDGEEYALSSTGDTLVRVSRCGLDGYYAVVYRSECETPLPKLEDF